MKLAETGTSKVINEVNNGTLKWLKTVQSTLSIKCNVTKLAKTGTSKDKHLLNNDTLGR